MARRVLPPFPAITEPGQIIYGRPVDGNPAVLSVSGNPGRVLTENADGVLSWESGGGGGAGHDAVTVVDSTSINFTLGGGGQELTAVAIFGTTTGTVAEGDHNHDADYADVSHTHIAYALAADLANYQPVDAQLTTLSGLTPSADSIVVWTGATTAVIQAITAAGRALLDDVDAAAQIATLGLDADIATLSLPASTTITAFAQTILDDASAAAVRTTLALVPGTDVAEQSHVDATGVSVHGLGTMSTQAASGVAITGGSITGITDLAVADGGTGASSASAARTNLGLAIGTDVAAQSHVAATGISVHGLGTMSTQSAAAVAITGGSITGITDLAIADGGTGASSASAARTNLGLVIGTDVAAQSHTHTSDPVTTFSQTEHFLNSGATGLIVTNTGDGTWAKSTDDPHHPGIWQQATGNTNGNVNRLHLGDTNARQPFTWTENFDFTFIFRTLTWANMEFFLGLHSDISGATWAAIDNNNHIGLLFQTAVHSTWHYTRTATPAAPTEVNSLVTVLDNTWYKVRIRRVDASTLGITLNANAEVQYTTNIPTSSAGYQPCCWIRTTNNTTKQVHHDVWMMYAEGLVNS